MQNKHAVLLRTTFLGPTQAGKTSLMGRLANGSFNINEVSTIGAGFKTADIDVNNKLSVRFQIWDTAGQTRYWCLIPMYFREASCAFFTVNATDLLQQGDSSSHNKLFSAPEVKSPFLALPLRVLLINCFDLITEEADNNTVKERALELAQKYQCHAYAIVSAKDNKIYLANALAPHQNDSLLLPENPLFSRDFLPWVYKLSSVLGLKPVADPSTASASEKPLTPVPPSYTEPTPPSFWVRALYFVLRHHREIIIGLIGLTLAVLFFTVPGLQVLGPGALILSLGSMFSQAGMTVGGGLLLAQILLPILAGVAAFAVGYGLGWMLAKSLPKSDCALQPSINRCVGLASEDDAKAAPSEDDEHCLSSILGCFSCPPSRTSARKPETYRQVDMSPSDLPNNSLFS